MVGGQRPPLPQGEALRRRHLWKQDASPPAWREGGGGREREREGGKRGRVSDRESESKGEGGKKEESLYLMVGGQRANTSPEASRRAKVTIGLTLSMSLSICLSISGLVSLSVSPCRKRTLLIRQIYTIIMVGGQRMLSFFVSSLPAFLNF